MRYPKAPIQEAVFDIKVNKVENVDVDSYESLVENELEDYPEVEKKIELSGKLRIDFTKGDVKTEERKDKLLGVVFSKKESNIKIQFRKDGFTLNMLKPYSDWNEFSKIAFKYWTIYKNKVKPVGVKRIALRYINRINLPIDDLNFDDYLNNIPEIPTVFEDSYADFLLRTVTICKGSGNPTVLTRRIGKADDNSVPFIIDIDVFKKDDIDNDSLKDEFEVLRNNKNDIFESLITDKSRELFQ